MVDDGWKALEAEPELEPVIVEVLVNNAKSLPRNGYGGNGHIVEPGVVNGNSNGHPNEPAEGQQSLFSCEFLPEEPARPQGRSGKAKPSSLSFFDWPTRV